MTDSVDLYRAPQAALDKPLTTPLDGLPSPSTWLVFFLTVITAGIYMVWWLYNRSVAINRILGATAISFGYTAVVPALYAVSMLISVLDGALGLGLNEQAGAASLMLGLFQLGVNIAFIFWAFAVRKHLRVLFSDRVHVGPVMTFFFGSLYLNYKIREAKELAQPAQVNVPADAATLTA
ncbi:MAG: DUF4234 domain-containing protein [Gammaproteobacteria bacterium]